MNRDQYKGKTNTRLQAVQQRLNNRGARVLGISFAPDVKERVANGTLTVDEVKNDTAAVFESYLNGNYTTIEGIDETLPK
jgi:hypothetical protein